MLALIKTNKIVNENMFKILHEMKSSANDFDNECIYCKYSQYAHKESAKVTGPNSVIPQSQEMQFNIENGY